MNTNKAVGTNVEVCTLVAFSINDYLVPMTTAEQTQNMQHSKEYLTPFDDQRFLDLNNLTDVLRYQCRLRGNLFLFTSIAVSPLHT